MAKRKKSSASRAKKSVKPHAYPVEFRLRMVRLFLEEGYSKALLCEQFGVSAHSIQRWVLAYRRYGVKGLEPKQRPSGKSKVPGAQGDHPIVDIEPAKDLLGIRQQPFEFIIGSLRCRELDQLHLVELVLANDTPCILSV